MATFAKKHGIRVYYYISPHLWAWKKGRIKTIKKYFDKLFVILPFEVDFYKQHQCAVDFVGNPVADAVDDFKHNFITNDFRQKNNLTDKPIVALLAGSRKQEIEKCLPEMLKAVNSFSDYQFVIAGAPSIPLSLYQKIIKDTKVSIVQNQTYALLSNAYAAVVTSGTATLETALFDVPQIVIYKLNEVSLFIARRMVKIQYFSLVNLISNKPVVKELLQYNLSEGIKHEIMLLLKDDEYRHRMINEYKLIREKIGQHASQKTAQLIYKYLTS
jgi:lipid-A-disaccharide synthase